MPTPGVETPLTTDEAVVVTAADVLQGVGVGGLRRVRRLGRVVWWFLAVMVRWLDVRKQGGRVAVSANLYFEMAHLENAL